MKSELLIFDNQPLQTSMEKGGWVDFHPLTNPASGGPIEFHVAASDDYVDLNDTLLYIKATILNNDNTNLGADVEAAATNLWLGSLFSDVSLMLNGKQIEGGGHMYSYQTYFSTIIQYGKQSKKTHLAMSGFVKDDASQFDNIANTGHVTRRALTAQSRNLELCGPLALDFFRQSKYLIGQVDIRLKFTRQDNSFAIFSNVNAANFKVIIRDAILYVRKVSISPSIVNAHTDGLRLHNAIYPVQHTEMTTFSIAQGSQSYTKENLFRGHMPKLVVLGMVENRAFNGAYNRNPFNFQHFGLNYLALFREGESTPFRPFTPDFNNHLCVREYMALAQSLGLYNRDEDNDITFNDFRGGTAIFAFNMAPDLEISGAHGQPYRDGNLRLDVKFSAALANAINVVVMAVIDGKAEITKSRDVLMDYKT